MPKSDAVLQPNLGLYLGQPRLGLSPRSVIDGQNFRVHHGKLSNINLGWTRFGAITYNGAIKKIDDIFLRSGQEHLLIITPTDIYKYNANDDTADFLTPRYATGTASANGTAVTGVGTNWDPEAKAGDEIHFGNAAQTDPLATWYTIQTRNNDTSLTLTASAGIIANGAYTIRKKFTADFHDEWSTAMFYNASPSNADEWWATNGIDDIVRWDGVASQVEVMSSLNFKAKVLAVYSNMMMFMNLTQAGTNKPADLINSNVGEPQNVSSGLSEQFKVHGNFGEIYKADLIGDALAIYSRYTITMTQFIGDGDLVFAFRQAVGNQGAVGFHAVANFGDYHQFIGSDGLYDFDGVSLRNRGEHVWRQVLSQFKPASRTTTFNVFNDIFGELIWAVPQTGDPEDQLETAYTEHYLEPIGQNEGLPFSRREFPFTAAGFFSQQSNLTWDSLTGVTWEEFTARWNDQALQVNFPNLLVGDVDGKIYILNTSNSKDGEPLSSFVLFPRRPLWDGRIRGLLTRVYPFAVNGSTQFDVTVHMYDTGETISGLSDTQVYDGTDTIHFTVHYRRGRFFEMEFGSDGEPWEISGYDIDKRPEGTR